MSSPAISRSALVLGGNGQDGTYLSQALLRRGHQVISIGKDRVPRNVPTSDGFSYHSLDLRDRAGLAELLREHAPSSVYHFAAVHKSAAGAPYEDRFGDMLDVNVASVHVVLEHLRRQQDAEPPPGRLIYASSIKAFGEPLPERIDEDTPRRSNCLYAVTKNAATDLIHHYRLRHDVQASVVWLANHESPRRPADFFIPKLARCLASAVVEPVRSPPASFYTLDFHCDWGSAEEYADLVVDMLEQAPGQDFVLGTGRTVLARELVRAVFAARGLDSSDHVREAHVTRQGARYHVVNEKLQRVLGRQPERTIEDVIEELVESLEPSVGERSDTTSNQP